MCLQRTSSCLVQERRDPLGYFRFAAMALAS